MHYICSIYVPSVHLDGTEKKLLTKTTNHWKHTVTSQQMWCYTVHKTTFFFRIVIVTIYCITTIILYIKDLSIDWTQNNIRNYKMNFFGLYKGNNVKNNHKSLCNVLIPQNKTQPLNLLLEGYISHCFCCNVTVAQAEINLGGGRVDNFWGGVNFVILLPCYVSGQGWGVQTLTVLCGYVPTYPILPVSTNVMSCVWDCVHACSWITGKCLFSFSCHQSWLVRTCFLNCPQ